MYCNINTELKKKWEWPHKKCALFTVKKKEIKNKRWQYTDKHDVLICLCHIQKRSLTPVYVVTWYTTNSSSMTACGGCRSTSSVSHIVGHFFSTCWRPRLNLRTTSATLKTTFTPMWQYKNDSINGNYTHDECSVVLKVLYEVTMFPGAACCLKLIVWLQHFVSQQSTQRRSRSSCE
jgi:hypothetical protein